MGNSRFSTCHRSRRKPSNGDNCNGDFNKRGVSSLPVVPLWQEVRGNTARVDTDSSKTAEGLTVSYFSKAKKKKAWALLKNVICRC